MRLSEAIRLGAMNKPQGFGWYDDGAATCAMGAAMEAVGCSKQPLITKRMWPVLVQSPASCPACDLVLHGSDRLFAVGAIVVHLNDEHRWKREQIADWVESLEQRSGDTHASDAVGEAHEQPVAVNAR